MLDIYRLYSYIMLNNILTDYVMRVFSISLIVVLVALIPAFAQRSLREVSSPNGTTVINNTIDSVVVAPLDLELSSDDVILAWSPLRRGNPSGGPCLTGYRVYGGSTADDMQLLTTTSRPRFRHHSANRHPHFCYSVYAFYAGKQWRQRNPRNNFRDGGILLDFEEGEFELLPFIEEEDIDPNDWEVTAEEAFPGSERSLHLFGNTWKRMPFQRTDLTDSTVWSIGILSVDGDTMGEQQAFGIGDGSNELFYTFHGKRTIWDLRWMIANQDVHQRGQWRIFRLAVGYDWNIRYDYLPSIDELYFINDNDNTDPPAHIYFDQLTDITAEILPEPEPKFRWRIDREVEGPGIAVEFHAGVDNRAEEDISYRWDFGDGSASTEQNPLHIFRNQGAYTVGLFASDNAGQVGHAASVLELGELRLPTRITAAFSGDVMLARRYENVGGVIRERGPEAVFEHIVNRLERADLFVTNLECPLTDEGIPHATKDIIFRGRPENVAGLVYAGVDIAVLANNHVIDYGLRGMQETQEILDGAGILYCGAGENEYEALQPAFKTINGIRVGVLSFCNRTGRDYNMRPFLDAGFDRYGYAYFSAYNLERSVPDAADQCDLLVVEAHGGSEYAQAPAAFDPNMEYPPNHDERIVFTARVDSAMRELEHLAIDLGAGLVIGHHPHVLQGFEVYNGVLIAHSLGNFAFDQNFWETWPSALVWTEIDHGGVQQAWIEPVFVDRYCPTPAVGVLGRKILDRLAGYSRELNAIVVPEYHQMRARIVFDPQRVVRRESEHVATGQMRYIEAEDVYRSEPIRLQAGGFPCQIISIDPQAQDAGWEVSLGRDILLIGHMEPNGAEVWNYNSNWEGRDSTVVHDGRYSSYILRQQNWQDGITDLRQRIPVDRELDRLTLCGWLRTTNALDGGLLARYYRFRYNNQPQNILGDQPVEGRLQGDHDWTYLWDQLVIPERTFYLNVRWQLFGPAVGNGRIWADDVEIIRWEEFQPFDGNLSVDIPSDLYYLQVQTRRPVESVEIAYRTATLQVQ